MRAAVLGIAMGLIMGTSALAQEDKSSANYMLPYCRAAVNNQSPTLTIDAVLQGMCVGIVDASTRRKSKNTAVVHPVTPCLGKPYKWSLPT
jgi:hypothetical protein